MIATIENMREHYAPGVLAFSPLTGEQYSANPADYWTAPSGFTLTDAGNEPMILATRRETFVEVSA